MKRTVAVAVALLATLLTGCAHHTATLTVGMVYPSSGPQGPEGTAERHGAELAVTWVNTHGGVNGRQLKVLGEPVDRPDGMLDALATLQAKGVSVVVGTHGSLYSAAAAAEATRRHMLLWETGAVGLTDAGVIGGTSFIRMAPMGANLGKAAVDFIEHGLGPHLPAADQKPLRWAFAYVDDVYGRAVADGAEAEAVATGQPVTATFPYPETGADYPGLAARIAAVHPDVLYVSAYLSDGVALRRAVAAAKVPLLANIGTSSSYCMPAFGAQLGAIGVGLFASDKPDAAAVNTNALTDEGRATLAWASARYRAEFGQPMDSHALSGFSNAYALFAHVLPRAGSVSAGAVSAAAESLKLPVGTLANGGGLDLAPVGAPDAGNNRNAAGVIWEWVAPAQRAVVWPPAFATHPVVWLPIDA